MTRSSDNQKTLPPFATMRAFEAVGRLCGVRRAAQALNLDHGVVSRHLRTLEEWAGVRLVNRIDGKTALSAAGVRYHTRISAALAELTDASTELLHRNENSRLNIYCDPGFASEWLISRLRAFQSVNSDITLELHPTDHSADFTRYEADVDIRYVAGNETLSRASMTGVRSFEISRPPVYAVASPELAADLSHVKTPADLRSAPLLHEENECQWRAWFAELGVANLDTVLKGPRLWHAHLTLEAARRSQGVALANPFLLGDDLTAGRLVRLPAGSNSDVTLGAYGCFARADRWQAPAIVRFRHWLKNATIISVGMTNSINRAGGTRAMTA